MAPADRMASVTASRDELAASRLVRRVVSQWWLILACAVVAAVIGFVASATRPDRFDATTTIQLNEVDLAAVFLGQNLQQQGQDAQSKAATNAKLVSFPRVREAASRALAGRVSADAIEKALKISAELDTTLIDITATRRDPREAQQIANAVREAFIEIRREAAVGQFTEARASLTAQLERLPAVQRSGPEAEVIRDRLTQVETLRAASNGGVETVQAALVPTQASAPRPRRDAVLALFAGGLLGAVIALLRARRDDRIRDADELSEHWDLPVLGLIPQSTEFKADASHAASGAVLEAFALARTNLRYLHVGGDVKIVVVTSAIAEEGKSTVTWNLAIAAALADARVLVIDADLRRPVIAQRAGVTANVGLSELLAGIAKPDGVVVEHSVETTAGTVTIDVVPAGMAPPSPISLFERGGTGGLIRGLGDGYDVVLIDTPPATVVADAKVLLEHADGVIVVSRLNRVTGGALDRLRELLTGVGTPVLGTVVNSGTTAKSYGYHTYESTPQASSSKV